MPRNSDLVFLVPLPRKDRLGAPISKTLARDAVDRMLAALGSWFGSATALPSWGSWKRAPGASLLIDRGQTVLLVLTTSAEFRRHRRDLTRLLRREGQAMNQDQMAAIAFKSAKGTVLIRCRPLKGASAG